MSKQDPISFVLSTLRTFESLESQFPDLRVFPFTEHDMHRYAGIMKYLVTCGKTCYDKDGKWHLMPKSGAEGLPVDSFIESFKSLREKTGELGWRGWRVYKVFVSSRRVCLGHYNERSMRRLLGDTHGQEMFPGWETVGESYNERELVQITVLPEEKMIEKKQRDPEDLSEEVKLGRLWLKVREYYPNVGVTRYHGDWVAIRQTTQGVLNIAPTTRCSTEAKVLDLLIQYGIETTRAANAEVQEDRVKTLVELETENTTLRKRVDELEGERYGHSFK